MYFLCEGVDVFPGISFVHVTILFIGLTSPWVRLLEQTFQPSTVLLFFLTSWREKKLLGGPIFLFSTSLVNSSAMESILCSFPRHLESENLSDAFVYLTSLFLFLDVKYFA